MNFTDFKKWNIIFGWIAFGIALVTYTLTLEPTVSYWDCGEYISTAVKLEVGHPPGAPLFQMIGAFFAMFTTDASQVAQMVNFMSALASAFTILFMFWTITYLGQKLLSKDQKSNIALFGAAFVGSLAYTFSDSFWFSAVEAEVYAMSSFLMALLFWLGLRWESDMDNPQGNKWLVLISFIVGLSFGVHILSLLVIPSIVFIYIFKNYKINNIQKFVIANVISVMVLMFVFKFLFPFTLRYFSAFELFFVNNIGMPFNSGSIIAALLLIGVFYTALKYTRSKKMFAANTLVLVLVFTMIGFSSWLMLPIRANANTTINENNPSSARELLAYYNREQYGDSNVFYDNYYSFSYEREYDASNPTRDEKPKYEKDEKTGTYIIVNNYKDALPNWSNSHKGFIPRMVAYNSPSIIANYKSIVGIPQKSQRRPTFAENLHFMIEYQFGYMYGRYFMWNFVGRQNDVQGQLNLEDGNWLSGINFIDSFFLGTQQNLPDDIKNNKGRNTYFFLPFILGFIGLMYQLKRNKKDFYTLLLFFAFTGLAIIFYTNPKPFEPRERDYAVVGSFYIFAIWIGFGVLSLFEALSKYANKKQVAIAVSAVCLLAVPVLMASQNWDDHDRSGRYTSRLNAKAYIDSCAENAIMFTIGDNDTFPLWYMQEVENHRTDIKLINSSLFATDWYIDQMKRATYDAPPIPSQLTHDDYKLGSLDIAYHVPFPQFKDTIIDIKYLMRWLQSDNENTFIDLDEDGRPEKVYPTNRIRIPVNKEAVLRNGIVAQKDADLILPYIDITIDEQGLQKNRILMLDILANNDWQQPIYFTGGAQAAEEYIWLKDYLQLDGMAYKLVPIKTVNKSNFFEMGRMDSELMYEKVKAWEWGNINSDKIYLDVESRKNSVTYRNNMERLAATLIREGDSIRAEEILDLAMDKMPTKKFGHYSMLLPFIDLYYKIDRPEKARNLNAELANIFQQHLVYYSQYNEADIEIIYDPIEANFNMFNQLIKIAIKNDTQEYADQLKDDLISYMQLFPYLFEE